MLFNLHFNNVNFVRLKQAAKAIKRRCNPKQVSTYSILAFVVAVDDQLITRWNYLQFKKVTSCNILNVEVN